jgi:hypothetical protein
MVYMAGFNSLSPAATEDLREMRTVGTTDAVAIAAFVKQQDRRGARHVIVGNSPETDVVHELGDADSGSPQTLLDFARWATETMPAERGGPPPATGFRRRPAAA